MLGSFPPPRKRWCMDFFHPNRSKRMWLILDLNFFGDSHRRSTARSAVESRRVISNAQYPYGVVTTLRVLPLPTRTR